MSDDETRDAAMRASAVEQLRRRSLSGVPTFDNLATGFTWAGECSPLINPQRGIFRPRTIR